MPHSLLQYISVHHYSNPDPTSDLIHHPNTQTYHNSISPITRATITPAFLGHLYNPSTWAIPIFRLKGHIDRLLGSLSKISFIDYLSPEAANCSRSCFIVKKTFFSKILPTPKEWKRFDNISPVSSLRPWNRIEPLTWPQPSPGKGAGHNPLRLFTPQGSLTEGEGSVQLTSLS